MKIVNGWVDTANEYNIMQNSMSREGYSPTHIVIHATAGGSYAKDVAAYEASAGVSTHFIIGVDGEIGQEVSCEVAAWGNAPLKAPRIAFDNADVNPNFWTISIEFCKPDVTNQIDITDAQFASGATLIALICDTYGIAKRAGDGHSGIISHADINSIDRARCPGTFRWDQLYAFLNNGGNMISDSGTYGPGKGDFDQYFTVDSNGNWISKKYNAVLLGGNRDFFSQLSIDGTSLPLPGLPMKNEQYHKEPDGYQWSSQECERATIWYDPEHRKDSQPGAGSSYLAHVNPPQTTTVTVTKLPDVVASDIKAEKAASDKLMKDAGLN